MNKDITDSLNYLLKEYKRLKKKEEYQKITKEEKDILIKLTSFLGKSL